MGHKPVNGVYSHASADTVLGPGDTILIAGPTAAVEHFTDRAAG